MKKITAIWILCLLTGCYDDSAERENTPANPALDSNTVAPVADSNTALQYLDNPHSDTFSIAMDSAGPTVTAEDTSLRKR